MEKVRTAPKQVMPKLYLNNTLIPQIKLQESFTYLGKHFDFEMTSNQHKTSLLDNLKRMLQTIDALPLHPRNKIKLYQQYILPKLSWDLTISDISITWVKQALDPLLASRIRQWLEIPINGTLDILSLTKSKYGIGLITIANRFLQCQVTLRNCMKNSKNADIRKIHEVTNKGPNIKIDTFTSTQVAIKDARNVTQQNILERTIQSLIIKAIWTNTMKSAWSTWHKALENLPSNIYSFTLRYLNNTLANGTNMLKWSRTANALCPACQKTQTLGHVVGGCKAHLREGRYNYRHDSVLLNIAKALIPQDGITMYVDLPNYRDPSIITGMDYRPDILFIKQNKLYLIELTVGFEPNITKH